MSIVIADVRLSRVHMDKLCSIVKSKVGRNALEQIVTDLSLDYYCDEPREVAAGVYRIDCYKF